MRTDERGVGLAFVIWTLAGLLVAVAVGVHIYQVIRGQSIRFTTSYQAVLLTNGSVYFGHLQDYGSSHPVLTDVYYVVSQGNPETKQVTNSLIKRGKELHEPDRVRRVGRAELEGRAVDRRAAEEAVVCVARPGRTRTDNIQLRRLALYPVELRSERLLVGPSPVDVFGDKTPLTDRVLDRRNFRRARPVRVERHELPSALERRGEKDRELPYFGH